VRLTFRHNFNLEASNEDPNLGFDGGVLELSTDGGNTFQDITVWGSFESGGYNRIIATDRGGPIAGRPAWSGNSQGFITTVANLPPELANAALRWRMVSDNTGSSEGWRVDTTKILWCHFSGTPTPTPPVTPMMTPTVTPTATPTATVSPTPTPTATATPRATPRRRPTPMPRPTERPLPSPTPPIVVDVAVGPAFAFVPSNVYIPTGGTVRWTWASNGHSVTSGTLCTADGQVCSPDDMNCDAGTHSTPAQSTSIRSLSPAPIHISVLHTARPA
jgi:hypothetical protein